MFFLQCVFRPIWPLRQGHRLWLCPCPLVMSISKNDTWMTMFNPPPPHPASHRSSDFLSLCVPHILKQPQRSIYISNTVYARTHAHTHTYTHTHTQSTQTTALVLGLCAGIKRPPVHPSFVQRGLKHNPLSIGTAHSGT